ncbi:MAG: hypothetical protein AAFN10_00230, partial [Bacteroidota bacterium]
IELIIQFELGNISALERIARSLKEKRLNPDSDLGASVAAAILKANKVEPQIRNEVLVDYREELIQNPKFALEAKEIIVWLNRQGQYPE